MFVIPPGKFFDPARKQNLLIINTGYNYIYTLRSHLAGLLTIITQLHFSYSLTRHISSWKKPCKSSLAWKEDDCKLGQESLIINTWQFLSVNVQFSASFREKFNCTVPWLHYLTPTLNICRPNTRQPLTSTLDQGLLIFIKVPEFRGGLMSDIVFLVTPQPSSTTRPDTPPTPTVASPVSGWTWRQSLRPSRSSRLNLATRGRPSSFLWRSPSRRSSTRPLHSPSVNKIFSSRK